MMVMICDSDKDKVLKALVDKGYTPTYIATTGEFLHYGKSILMLGVEENNIEDVNKIIEENTSPLQISENETLQVASFVMNARCIRTK